MSEESPVVIRFDQARLFQWLFPTLLAVAAFIVLLDALISEFEWVSIGAAQRFLNITREDGIANFFSSFQMLAVGFVLVMITVVVRSRSGESGVEDRHGLGSDNRPMWLLTVGYITAEDTTGATLIRLAR